MTICAATANLAASHNYTLLLPLAPVVDCSHAGVERGNPRRGRMDGAW